MLKFAGNEHRNDLKKVCGADAFGTRIEGYYITYGSKFDFCRVWIQYDENEDAVAAVCDMSGDMTVCAAEQADFDELAAFINMSGFSSLQCEKGVMRKLGLTPNSSGYVLRFTPCEYDGTGIESSNTELKEIYGLIKGAGVMGVGDYLPWLSDVTYRVNHGTALPAVIKSGGAAVSCAMALFITDSSALLGAVATKESERGKGYAGRLVKYLGNKMISENKKTNLLCKHGTIVDFYKSIGFEIEGEWSAILREEE